MSHICVLDHAVATSVSLFEWFVNYYSATTARIRAGAVSAQHMAQLTKTFRCTGGWFAHTCHAMQWPQGAAAGGPVEGVVTAGDLIYVPRGWWHCVLNVEESIALTQNFGAFLGLWCILLGRLSNRSMLSPPGPTTRPRPGFFGDSTNDASCDCRRPVFPPLVCAVSKAGLRATLDFLRTKPDQVSGVKGEEAKQALHDRLSGALQAAGGEYPALLAEATRPQPAAVGETASGGANGPAGGWAALIAGGSAPPPGGEVVAVGGGSGGFSFGFS